MFDMFSEFVDSPTRQTYLALRRALIKHSSYQPYANRLTPLQEKIDAGAWAEMLAIMPTVMPEYLLSPRLHMLASMAHEKLGNEEGAEMERFLWERCIEGIRLTGNGTADQPYLVMRISDEYDLLMAMGTSLKRQELITHNERVCDHMECTDGTSVWFDVTDMQQRGFGDASPAPPDPAAGNGNGNGKEPAP